MEQNLRISGIIPESIVDGPGIRYTIFVQGCPHHCPGCHNPQTHNFEGGTIKTIESIAKDVRKNPLICGVTFSGGEPMCQAAPLTALAKDLRRCGKDIICYTGYTFEELMEHQDPQQMELLEECRYLIDGPFLQSKKSMMVKFRGSTNQRILDVPASLTCGHAVEASF